MKVIVLASGSKGNATYIETANTKILIDAGISLKRIKEELTSHNIYPDHLDAILVTHEHIDHVKELASVANYFNTNIYIHEESFYHITNSVKYCLDMNRIFFINVDKRYTINDLTFVPMQLFHDTKNCYGYFIKANNLSLAYMTDTGRILEKYYKVLKNMNVLIMESNHDVEMLLNSSRPYILKQRILSDKGHLSNEQCANYLKEFISDKLQTLVLAHLSEECNTEDIAYKTISDALNEINLHPNLMIAKQNESIEVVND